jgi:hypothetical protein
MIMSNLKAPKYLKVIIKIFLLHRLHIKTNLFKIKHLKIQSCQTNLLLSILHLEEIQRIKTFLMKHKKKLNPKIKQTKKLI